MRVKSENGQEQNHGHLSRHTERLSVCLFFGLDPLRFLSADCREQLLKLAFVAEAA